MSNNDGITRTQRNEAQTEEVRVQWGSGVSMASVRVEFHRQSNATRDVCAYLDSAQARKLARFLTIAADELEKKP